MYTHFKFFSVQGKIPTAVSTINREGLHYSQVWRLQFINIYVLNLNYAIRLSMHLKISKSYVFFFNSDCNDCYCS